ncbi:hypothetical protein V1477_006574 [Vespula maculifrons]|uniref:Uncharacterized protein n=1 Tax=Vespula maculifrons TaxID=7453 RepID=A0ABD2CJA0_VESMC
MTVHVSPNHTSCIIVRVEHPECYSVVSQASLSESPDFLFPFSRDEVHITRISMFAVALTSGVYLSYGYEVDIKDSYSIGEKFSSYSCILQIGCSNDG